MHTLINNISTYAAGKIKCILILLSMVIALQVQYIQHGWINPDSLLYLEAAKLFSLSQWEAGYAIFPWPFYSLWIAATHTITQLNIHQSAQLLNILFFGIACASFLKIIQLAGGKQLQIIAGGIILLSAQYLIGGALEMLMRDEGFWAFYLTSLVFFIQFYQHRQLKHALLWQCSIILATLFRIEAILYLLLLPLIFLFDSSNTISARFKLTIQALSIQLIIGLAITVMLVTNDHFSTSMLGRLNEIFTSQLPNDFVQNFVTKSQVMANLVLGKYLDDFAVQGLALTLIYIIFAKAISTTGLISTGLAVFGFKQRKVLMEKKSHRVLAVTASIAALNMALIISKVFVLSGRYVLALSLILMVFASFYLASLLEQLKTKTPKKSRRWLVTLLLIVMMLGLIKNVLPKRDGYNYQQTAVAWVQSINTENKLVFYSDPRQRYYANVPFIRKWPDNWKYIESEIDNKNIFQYDYLSVIFSKRDQNKTEILKQKLPNYKEINRFYDAKHKKYCVIYLKQS